MRITTENAEPLISQYPLGPKKVEPLIKDYADYLSKDRFRNHLGEGYFKRLDLLRRSGAERLVFNFD